MVTSKFNTDPARSASVMSLRSRRVQLVVLSVALVCLLLPAIARSEGDTVVVIDNFKFSRPTLIISKGTEVSWKNQDDIPHSVVLAAIGIRSKTLDTDNTFSYRFDKAGTFAYICGLHPFMRGQVVVR